MVSRVGNAPGGAPPGKMPPGTPKGGGDSESESAIYS